MKVNLENFDEVGEYDERAAHSKAPNVTFHGYDTVEEMGCGGDWSVHIQSQTDKEIFVYDEGRIAYAFQVGNEQEPEDTHLFAALLDVDENYTEKAVDHVKDNIEELSEDKLESPRMQGPKGYEPTPFGSIPSRRTGRHREGVRTTISEDDASKVFLQDDETKFEGVYERLPRSMRDILGTSFDLYNEVVRTLEPLDEDLDLPKGVEIDEIEEIEF